MLIPGQEPPTPKLQLTCENAGLAVATHPLLPGGRILVVQLGLIEVHVPMDMASAITVGRALASGSSESA